MRSDGEVTGSKVYRGENAVGTFLSDILQEEEKIRESLATPKPIEMMWKDWENFKRAADCHVCNKSLIKDEFLDTIPVWDHDTGRYCGQSHKRCYYAALKELKLLGQKEKKKRIAKNQETCLFCAEPFMKKNFRDAVKDHCHITGRYRGAAHNECNTKLRINPKTDKIPVVFHNLRGYDVHHLIKAMSQQQKEVNCIANNMEKYITFSLGGLRFIDSLNFLQGSLVSVNLSHESMYS